MSSLRIPEFHSGSINDALTNTLTRGVHLCYHGVCSNLKGSWTSHEVDTCLTL